MSPDFAAPFRLEGDRGEAAVLIHGFTGHPGHWRPAAERLVEEGYTVAAPRLAGHGSTRTELQSSRWRQWLHSVLAEAESVADHRRVHLVGLSLGGLLAILAARPSAAASVTTINSPLLLRQSRAYLAPLARHIVPFASAPGAEVPDPDLAHLWVSETSLSTAAVDQLLRVTWHAWGAAGRLRRPALVVQSSSDEAVRPVSGRLLSRRLKADYLEVESRHNALLDPSREVLHRALISHLGGFRVGAWGGR